MKGKYVNKCRRIEMIYQKLLAVYVLFVGYYIFWESVHNYIIPIVFLIFMILNQFCKIIAYKKAALYKK